MKNSDKARCSGSAASSPIGGRFALALAIGLLGAAAAWAAAGNPGSKDEILQVGRAALEDDLFDVAERQFQQYLQLKDLSPAESAQGTVLLARALYEQGKFGAMVALLAPALTRGPAAPQADEVAFWAAAARYGLGEPDAALALLDAFESPFKDSAYRPAALRLRARCLLKAGRETEAFQAFERYDQTYGALTEAADNLLDWGQALAGAGRDDEAIQIFGRLIAAWPESDAAQDGRLRLAQLKSRKADWDAVREILAPLTRRDTVRADRQVEAWYALSDALAAQGDIEAATNAAASGIARAPAAELKARGGIRLGRLCLKAGKVDEGVAVLKAVISANPADPLAGPLQLELAQALLDSGNHERAAEEFQYYLEAFTNQTGQAQALSGKGWALTNLKRYAEAASVFSKAYELHTTPAEKERALFKAADAYFSNGQFKSALEVYERVIHEFPQGQSLAHAQFQVCECIARLGEKDQAERDLLDLAQRYPQSPFAERALLRVAELNAERGNLAEALLRYDEVMRVFTNGVYYDNALYNHGLLSYQLLAFPAALQDFERLVKKFPESRFAEQAFYMRGWCHYMMGRNEEAVAVSTNFLARYPDSPWAPEVLFWIGEHDYNAGLYEKAEESFARLADQYPQDNLGDDARFWAGRSAAKRKEYLKAIEHFTRLAKSHPDSRKLPEARFFQGDALSELGEFAGAILIFDEIIAKYPTNALVYPSWMRKGDCQFTLGAKDPKRYTEALESYRVVAASAAAPADLRLQAEYKIGRCLEKMGRTEEAFEQYYTKVVGRYLYDRAAGADRGSGSDVWFTRAAFNAADLMEAQKNWRRAVRVLQRVIEADVPASNDARERIRRIRSEHWLLY